MVQASPSGPLVLFAMVEIMMFKLVLLTPPHQTVALPPLPALRSLGDCMRLGIESPSRSIAVDLSE